MNFLLDTDQVIDWLRGRRSAVDEIGASATSLNISLLSVGELAEGILFGTAPLDDERLFREFLRNVVVLSPNTDIMWLFGRIRGELRRRGTLIGDMDVVIAATAAYYGLTLVTRNFRHFERIPGLDLYRAG